MAKEYTKFITTVLLSLLVMGLAAGTANAFDFQGYTYNETKGSLNNTNVSIEVYTFSSQGPLLYSISYNSSNETGYFNVNVSGLADNSSYFYKIVLRHFNATNNTLDYIGQSLPEFPYEQILQLTSGTPIDFYLRPGGTINISAINSTGATTTFRYQVKDTRLGYPIASNFSAEVSNAVVYVPANRNYSIMIYPNQSFPVSYDLNNLTTYSDNYANITFNTSNTLRRVTGYANLSDGSANFTDLKIVAYLMEPGNMIFQDHPMPYNMSAWDCADPGPTNCSSDVYDPVNGTFNITLPGAQMTANILLFAAAYNSTGNYYGAFRNISLDYSNTPVPNFNFTLHMLFGTPTIISLNNASGGGPGVPPGTTNLTTKKLSFQLKNGTSGANITGFAHIEVEVNYSAYNGSTFNWMVDVPQSSNGSFSIPVINANINKINIFTQDFAPLKTSKTADQLASEPVVINLASFNPGAINESGPPPNINIDMLMSTTQCDVPNPAQGCSLFPAKINKSDFNPFRIVIGGGKISLRMRLVSNNITVHYKNVDMLASGPPDALFDPSANQSSQNGTTLEQAWRFGSMGPEIYDEVLVGIPLGSINPNNVSVKLGKLYDNNWNEVWNLSAGNTSSDVPSDYSTFSSTWFLPAGVICNTSVITSACYVDVANRMVWLTIPHFSGIAPTVSGTTGNLTVTLTNSTGIAGRSVIMNFTMNDTLNATAWYNITFPSGFDASGAVVNININNSADPFEWTKINGTGFVNVSSSIFTANFSVNQYINISNITIPQETGNKTINVTTSNGVTVSLNYTVVVAGAPNITSYAPPSPVTDTAGATRAFNITANQTVNVTWYINGTQVQYNATPSLNAAYTNTSAGIGTWTVNATANNTNGTVSREWVWNVTAAPTTTTTTSGGGGGGSGGGGVVTSEPYSNIEKAETYDKSLIANTPVTYTFKAPEHGIYEIVITGKENENDIALRVEVLKGPTQIAGISAPPGTVYKNVNVWAGSKRIKEGLIRFKVENSWIANNKIASGDLLMVRWNGKEWAKLDTSELKKDDTYTFYEAKTEGFSCFAITALKGGVVPTTPPGAVTETPAKPTGTGTPAPASTKKVPGFEGIMVIVAIALLVASLNNDRKRR